MAVFPESMERLNVDDTPGSLRRIENYIRYMVERMEFSNSNMTRNVNGAGVSTVEVLMALKEVTGALSEVKSTMSKMTGDITALGNRINDLTDTVKTAQEQITALADRVSALENGTEG